jgi:hypothetical protein
MDWKERKVYAVPNDSTIRDIKGFYFPYFYLHGKAMYINDYDICNADPEIIALCLRQGAFLCMVVFTDGTEHEAICFSKYNNLDRMQGLICLLDDNEHIEHAVKEELKFKNTPNMYGDEEVYLRKLGKFELIHVKQY